MKAIVLIDGGYLVEAKKAQKQYDPDFIEKFAQNCRGADEELFRILYYDCAQYSGKVKLPVSGNAYTFTANDAWLHELSHNNLFAVRRGVLKFRGYKPKTTPFAVAPAALTDADFTPDFEQKGVDMRIGLDIAAYSANRAIDRVVLVSNDTDCVPALKASWPPDRFDCIAARETVPRTIGTLRFQTPRRLALTRPRNYSNRPHAKGRSRSTGNALWTTANFV